MLVEDILSLRQQIQIIEQRLRGKSTRGVEFVDDTKLSLILKGLGQTLRTYNQLFSSQPLQQLVNEFLENNKHKVAPYSVKQISVFEYVDGFVLQMAKQASLPKELYQELLLVKIPLSISLLSPNIKPDAVDALRQYVECLVRALSGWTTQSGLRSDNFKNQVIQNVVQLSCIFPLRAEKIDNQKHKLLETVNRFFQDTHKLEQRLVEGLSKRIISLQASYHIDQMFNQLFASKKFSQYFIILMEQYWRKYLLSIYLRDGKGSEAWSSAEELTEKLTICWNLASLVNEKRKLKSLDKMREKMNLVHVDQKALQHLLSKFLQPVTPEQVIKIQKKNFKKLSDYSADVSNLDIAVKKLRVGEWVSYQSRGQLIKAKLVYKNLIENKFVFTNLSGKEVMDINGLELSRKIQKGKIKALTPRISCEDCDKAILLSSKKREQRVHDLFQNAKLKLAQEKEYLDPENSAVPILNDIVEPANGNNCAVGAENHNEELENLTRNQDSTEQTEREAIQAAFDQQAAVEERAIAIAEEVQRLSQLKSGGWVEFDGEDGTLKLEKLSFILNTSKRLVFVNEIGIRTREISMNDLAKLLVDGKANVSDWGNQFEQSLESLVNSQKLDRKNKDKPFLN